jgi:nucleoside-triphosphatase THEP1
MSAQPIAAVVYGDGLYPDRVIARALAPLRERGIPLAGVLQREAAGLRDRHPCDLLLEDLSSGEILVLAEHRGSQARGCRLDVGLLAEIAESIESNLAGDAPRLLVVNKFGKIEANGGGLRDAIAEAVDLGIPVLVGVPSRNLDRWRAFAGPFAMELPPEPTALASWLRAHGLLVQQPPPSGVEAALAA